MFKYDEKNNKLTITLELIPTAEAQESSTGKSKVVASSHGFMKVPGSDLSVSFNVIVPNKTKK